MRRVGFDYPNTCPVIDRQISIASGELYRYLDDLLEQASPLLPSHVRQNLAQEHADALYKRIEDCFEAVRKSNEDMRQEADSQIASLQDSIADLEADMARLEREAA